MSPYYTSLNKKPAIDSEVVQGMKQGFHNKVDFEEE
jgi:hypothetical protein